jgi:hypothetical protein
MNWKAIQEIANIVSGILIACIGLRRMARTGDARELDGGRVEFAPDWFAGLEPFVVLLPPSLATFGALRHGIHNTHELQLSALIGCAALAQMFSLPGTIVTSWEGLEQVY